MVAVRIIGCMVVALAYCRADNPDMAYLGLILQIQTPKFSALLLFKPKSVETAAKFNRTPTL